MLHFTFCSMSCREVSSPLGRNENPQNSCGFDRSSSFLHCSTFPVKVNPFLLYFVHKCYYLLLCTNRKLLFMSHSRIYRPIYVKKMEISRQKLTFVLGNSFFSMLFYVTFSCKHSQASASGILFCRNNSCVASSRPVSVTTRSTFVIGAIL